MTYQITGGKQEKSLISMGETDQHTEVCRNIAMLLGTPKGSVPLYRDFGISMDALDRPTQVARTLLLAQVIAAAERYEPRAEIVGVDVTPDPADGGRLIPTVKIRIGGDLP